jgi:hypothetical protein
MTDEEQEPNIMEVMQAGLKERVEKAQAFVKFIEEHKETLYWNDFWEEAEKHDIELRIVEDDGQPTIYTTDHKPWRINIKTRGPGTRLKRIIKVKRLG